MDWFNSIDDSLFNGCPPDIVSYAYLLQDSMQSTFETYQQNLENASQTEYAAYQSAIQNMNTLLAKYPDSSCKSTMSSWYSPDVLRKTYLTCANSVAETGQSFNTLLMMVLPYFPQQCNDYNVGFVLSLLTF